MASKPVLTSYETRAVLARQLADRIERQLRDAIAERGAASFAVSGGSTPAALYHELSRRKLDWSMITIILVDERWVAPGEEGSNESFVRASLMINEAACATLIGLWSDNATPQDGITVAERRLSGIDCPIDVVILGMGSDGHTASWFPNAEGLEAALSSDARVAAVTASKSAVTGGHLERITLTLGAVADAQLICLLIAGDDKRDTFEAALTGDNINDMPVRAILKARSDMMVCWAP